MSKHRSMANQLMDDIWLWSIEGFGVVADVLCRVEHLEGKSIQELTLCEQATNRLQSPTSSLAQKLADVFELRDFIFVQIDLLLKLSDCPIEFFARISLEHPSQVIVAELPDVLLMLMVVQSLDRVNHLIVECHLSDFLSASAVLFIMEARMISLLDSIAFRQYSLTYVVEIVYINWEPRNRF